MGLAPTPEPGRRGPDQVEAVLQAIRERLQDRPLLGLDPDEEADLMVDALPHDSLSPWADLLGPVYATDGVQRILGVTTRQAVDDARSRHRVVGFKTSDGRWAYPAFQFESRGGRTRPVEGLRNVAAVLVPAADGLAALRWLATRNRRLDQSRPIDSLRGGGDVQRVRRAAEAQAAVWVGDGSD
jgi:hypothetical protein